MALGPRWSGGRMSMMVSKGRGRKGPWSPVRDDRPGQAKEQKAQGALILTRFKIFIN
jgi:hypothetical protein